MAKVKADLYDVHIESAALNSHKLHALRPVSASRDMCIDTALRFRQAFKEFEFEKKGNIRYDLFYDGKPFDLKYTEIFAGKGGIIVNPASKRATFKMYRKAVAKRNTDRDFKEFLSDMGDKYIQYEYPCPKYKEVIILPGSNVLEKTVDKELLNAAVDRGAYVKPHPLTNNKHIRLFEKEYGKKVIPRMYSGAIVCRNAEVIYTALGSELGLLAELQGKEVRSIAVEDVNAGGYLWLHQFLRQTPAQGKYLNFLLNNPVGGVFFPHSTDEDFHTFLEAWKDIVEDL